MQLCIGHLYSQNTDWTTLEEGVKIGDYDRSKTAIEAIDTTQFTEFSKARYSLNKSKVLLLNDEHDIAFGLGQSAINGFAKSDSLLWLARSYINVYEIASHQKMLNLDKDFYLKKFVEIADQLQSPELLAEKYGRIGTKLLKQGNGNKAIVLYEKAIKYAHSNNDDLKASTLEFNKATAFQYTKLDKRLDSSLLYYKKTLPTFISYKHKNFISYNYANQVRLLNMMERHEEAKALRVERDSIKLSGSGNKTKSIYFKNEIKHHKSRGEFKEALFYTELKNKVDSIIDFSSQNNAIASAEVRFQTAEKEKQLLISEQKKKQNRNVAYGLGIGLFLVSLLGFFMYKNTKRKQRIAEQEREIEIQKKEKILKEQELNAIDAMIAGQEKERQRLASDLHDSVGATLSAAKLQFDHIAKNKTKLEQLDELFEKTGTLLNEAYNEVRTMAHLKNSGVIAKKGLLPAIEKLAKNASSSHGLMIEVQDFGLTEKLEGSLEISIFRIIQELVTNIIKHANATEASISITQHEDTLSIIVEDNGVGFNVRNINKKEGMGLSSIETRVEHLEGTMEVDTTLQKGTNILIDIPL